MYITKQHLTENPEMVAKHPLCGRKIKSSIDILHADFLGRLRLGVVCKNCLRIAIKNRGG